MIINRDKQYEAGYRQGVTDILKALYGRQGEGYKITFDLFWQMYIEPKPCPICGNPRDKCICDPGDGLRLCRTCGDRETTNADSICDSCKHQARLDEHA